MQTTRASVQHLRQNPQRKGVLMAEGRCMVINVHIGVDFRLGKEPFLGLLRHLQRDHIRRLILALLDSPEIFLGLRKRFLALEISHQNKCQVLRRIIGGVKLIGLRLGNRGDVRGPTNDRP